VLENHDVTRLPMRYGSLRAARAGLLLLLALPGAAFLYQGQELGLPEVDVPDEARQDPIFFRSAGKRVGRDGCRVPLPWTRETPSVEPWLPQPEAWGDFSVEAQEGVPGSTLELTRAALAARPRAGDLRWLDAPRGALLFERGEMICAVNVSATSLDLPPGDLVLASEPDVTTALPPDTAAWIRRTS
jgi:alpha-glucosidase